MDQWLDCLSVLNINNRDNEIRQKISLITYVPKGMCNNTMKRAIWNLAYVFVSFQKSPYVISN